MIDPALRAELATVFEFVQTREGLLALRRSASATLSEAGFGLHSDGAVAPSDLGGRRPLAALRVGHEEFLIRRFTHGGLLRWLTGRRFADPERVFREARVSEQLLAAGVATPQVVAARAVRSAGAWRLDLVTRRVPHARDLAAHFEGGGERRERARLLSRLGAWLARLHELGFLHADLHPKNVLVTQVAPHEPLLWVLDLDRSVLRSELGARERVANLARLVRYVWRRREALAVRRHDLARALRGYCAERGARRALWQAVGARVRSGALLHRAGWWLESHAGGAAGPSGPANDR